MQATLKREAPPRSRTFYPRDLLINLSLANLCCARIWTPLIDKDYLAALMNHSPKPVWLLAAIANVLLLAAVFTGLTTFARNRPQGSWQRLGRTAFAVAALWPALEFFWIGAKHNAYLQVFTRAGLKFVVPFCAVAGTAFALAAWRWHAAMARRLAVLFIMLSPALALTFGNVLLQLGARGPDPLAAKVLAPANAAAPRTPHVVWFIFDEWDYRFTFLDRKPDVALPEIDRIAQTSFSASQAIPAASETLMSIPMLLSGERYRSVSLSHGRLVARPFGDAPAGYNAWNPQSVFSDARAMGFNTALSGWYLPYCRLFPGELTACEWIPISRPGNSASEASVPRAMLDQARSLFETTAFSPFGNTLAGERHAVAYRELVSRSLDFASDPTKNLVFAHLPVPHYPFLYDRETGQFAKSISFDPKDYFDGLALLDRTIGEIRRRLEAAGQWDDSTILFSSDHFDRMAGTLDGRQHIRVPFLLKLPHQTSPARYTKPFNTITSRKMMGAILRGEIRTPEQAAAWLDRNAILVDTVHPDGTAEQP